MLPGLDFFITEIPNEVFTYSDTDAEPMQFAEARPDVYPYLLVNIGSGVSMIKVSGPRQFERVGGTHLGGGTFWGLMSLLTGARTFDDMLAMADRGDNAGVDMLVGDIYGMDYTKIGLKSTAIASTFGKVFRLKNAAEHGAEDGEGLIHDEEYERSNGGVNFRHEDMSRSLLYAIRYGFFVRIVLLKQFTNFSNQQQHRPNCLPTVRKASSQAHLLWRILHTGPPPDHEHTLLRHPVLVQGRETGLLPAP